MESVSISTSFGERPGQTNKTPINKVTWKPDSNNYPLIPSNLLRTGSRVGEFLILKT